MAKKIKCTCGRSFKNEDALNAHLRDSKTHQAVNFGHEVKSKATSSVSVPLMATYSPLTSISPALGTKPEIISYPMLTTFSLIRCTCGHAFKAQRILDLHKHDSLYYKRQTDQSSTRSEQCANSLVSFFASLNLESVSTRSTPPAARFTCTCGCIFTNQEALQKHKRLVWTTETEKRETVFKTPRPNYHEDEDLRDFASAHARQYIQHERNVPGQVAHTNVNH
jgi:acetone carboxylase gamma subunit